ncbi:hypothetical protein C4552_04310 [Candidatus Parcubacteria bacterium]|nr:MAG: hypothetical protein C4552_04310 [Candidatus Parcubacteria bacterium]
MEAWLATVRTIDGAPKAPPVIAWRFIAEVETIAAAQMAGEFFIEKHRPMDRPNHMLLQLWILEDTDAGGRWSMIPWAAA